MSDATISAMDYQRAVAEATRRKERIRSLEAQVAEKDKRIAELESAGGKAVKTIESLTAELDALKAKPADEKDKQIAELQRSIKERDLRDQFNAAAKGKVRDDALDAAWKLSGLSPDVELAENTVAESIEALVKGHAFLAPAPQPEPAAPGSRGADASGKPTVQPTGQPAPGAARGTVNHSTPPASADAAGKAGALDYAQKSGRGGNPYRVA